MARKRSSLFSRIQSILKPRLLPMLSLAIAILIVVQPMRTTLPVAATATENLLQQSQVYYDRQQYNNAVKLLQQAIADFEEDKLGKAIALGNLSLAYQQLGQWQEAEQAIAASLKLLPTPTEENITSDTARILAQTLDVRGRLQLKQGETQAALNTWAKTADLYRQLEDDAGIVRAHINQAQAMRGLGMYRQAEEILTEAKPT